jgi:signal transduction histidine kinase
VGRYPGFVTGAYATALGYLAHQATTGLTAFDRVGAQNQVARLIVYLFVAHVLASLREARLLQEQLLGFIVHDLRSPISNTITGLLTLEQSSEALSELDHEMVQLAIASSQRALALTNSMLDVAKLESGKMDVRTQTVEIEPFLEECLKQVALWAKSLNVDIVREIELKEGRFDPHLTSRVLVNLIGNALKISPRSGKVTLHIQKDPAGIRFLTRDQGPGIPPEFMDAIFEPFTQAKGTQGGTGLGLTFCRLAVQAQGGKIGVESTLGKGSTFWFVLPQRDHQAL